MTHSKLIAIALAALLVFAGGVAAMPGNAPDDPGSDATDDHAPEDPGAENETDGDGEDVNETDEDARAVNASDGPPTDMPEQVPDHVAQIHQLIRDKLNGDLGNTTLGEAISSVVGAEEEADENADGQSANAQHESENASEEADENRTDTANASVAGDLPQQAADHVSAIHDAITSFLQGNGDNPGDAVSSAASR